MNAIVLGWDPADWDAWQPAFPEVVELVAETGGFRTNWSLGFPQDPVWQAETSPGAEVWLLLTGGKDRGLIGHGVVGPDGASGHGNADPQPGSAVDVVFDALLRQGEHVPRDELASRVPGMPWDSVRGWGEPIPPAELPALRDVWADYAGPSQFEPTLAVPGALPDEALLKVSANRYEVGPQARTACIRHHGSSCAACGFNFAAAYGGLGKDYIQVHHIVPAAEQGADYQLDPLTDLVPLCANCHVMAHQRTPVAYSPAELRRLMAAPPHISGSVLSPEEESAQRDAARLLQIKGTGNQD
ncbi:HNH endonuclease [Arthrobacter sp. VKM Ac-2550]|uniref:HNH endonuclease n=1 Tax=Crystallibacter permensis TaxID=1938888 RepID=UPI002225CF6F|nr:HNH endonuclease [Arthrobacter sp. VKM Ac-2550]MCW2131459.1 5-methylcytosine-specific restriction enzyme A [Arthrobacter sp. VKM Ac-2550]